MGSHHSSSDFSRVMTTNRPANVETYFVQFSRSGCNAFIFDGFLVLSRAGTDTSQLLLLGKFEYGGGPIFKVVLEC